MKRFKTFIKNIIFLTKIELYKETSVKDINISGSRLYRLLEKRL